MTVSQGNEVQVVTVTGTPEGGTFTLEYDGQETAGIAYDAAAAAVQSALVALSNIGVGDVSVTGSAGGPWTVTFGTTLRNTDVAELVADGAGLTGGTSPDAGVSTSTAGNPAVTETAYADISVANGKVANVELLAGQVPPAGEALVDKSDYYGGS